MFLTVHTTAAIVITQRVANPLLAFVIGFISHFVLDAIPHGDDQFFNRWTGKAHVKILAFFGAIDLIITTAWLAFIWTQGLVPDSTVGLSAAIGSILPDILTGTYLITQSKQLKWIGSLNQQAHHWIFKKTLAPIPGFLLQTIFFVILVVIVFTI